MRLSDQETHCEPDEWDSNLRTMPMAHSWIREHFDEIQDGDVVDVQFLAGVSSARKSRSA